MANPIGWKSGSSFNTTAGDVFFAVSIVASRTLIEKMVSSHGWSDERAQTRTHKIHQLEEVDILAAKIDLLMKKVEVPGMDHVKMVDTQMAHEECGDTGHRSINCPKTHEDMHFVGSSSNGIRPNQGFNSG